MLKLCLLLALILPAVAEPNVEAALPRWRQLIGEAMKETGVPGCSVGVVYKGKVVLLEAYGITNVDQPSPVTPDTVFRLASCSKPLSSTAVAALVGEGKLTWSTPVHDLMPDFALRDPWVTAHLTVADCLSHRTGLPGQAGNELEELGYDQAFILRALRQLDLDNRFRSTYDYSNYGYTAGCEAAARGKYPEMMQEQLFGPAGMTSSSARYADFLKVTNPAYEHILENGKAVRRYDRAPDAQAPAGGVFSTARDLTRYLLLQLGEGSLDGKQLVAREALLETHKPFMLTGYNPATFSSGFYGLGWAVSYDRHGYTIVKHSGAFSTGSRTQLVLVPELDLGIVILCNAFPTGLPEGLSQQLLNLVEGEQADLQGVLEIDQGFRQAMAGMLGAQISYASRPSQPMPPGPASRYDGVYQNAYFGPLKVENMQVSWGPGYAIKAPLQPWDGDTFFAMFKLNDSDSPTLVRFEGSKVTLVQYDDWGTGVFTR